MSDTAVHHRKDAALTPLQMLALQLIADGRPRPEVALELNITIHTLNDHIKHAFMRLGVHSIECAVAAAMRRGEIK